MPTILLDLATDQAPHDFIDRPENYADRLFVACIKRWPISSLHPVSLALPFHIIVGCVLILLPY